MKKVSFENNIATEKTLIIAFISLIITYFLRPKGKGKKKKKSISKRYNKIFGLISALVTQFSVRKAQKNIKNKTQNIKTEEAIIIDL